MTLHDIINSRIASPVVGEVVPRPADPEPELDAEGNPLPLPEPAPIVLSGPGASPEYLAELAKIDAETGRWVVRFAGVRVLVSTDPSICDRVGCTIEPAESAPCRVLKDTIVQRMKAAGLLGNLAAMVASLPPEDRFEFDQSSWFSSANPRIRAGIAACGGDPDAILAFDPLA